jgi:signal recognition particle GTPase
MSEAELDNPDLINGAAKERIAASTGQSVEIVAQLLFYYKQTRILSTWLKMR